MTLEEVKEHKGALVWTKRRTKHFKKGLIFILGEPKEYQEKIMLFPFNFNPKMQWQKYVLISSIELVPFDVALKFKEILIKQEIQDNHEKLH